MIKIIFHAFLPRVKNLYAYYLISWVQLKHITCSFSNFSIWRPKAATPFLQRAGGHEADPHHAGPPFDPKVGAVLVHVHAADFPVKHQGQVANSEEDPPRWRNGPLPTPAVTHVPSRSGAHRGLDGAGKWWRKEGRKGFAFVQLQWTNYLCNLLRKGIDVGWRGSCSPIFAI